MPRRRAASAAAVRGADWAGVLTRRFPVRESGALVGCVGEVGGAEGGAPDAVEVVLGFAQVQGEGVVEQAEPGQGLLQAVDGAGGGFEVAVQVVGGGVVGGAFGQQSPLLAFASPVEQVGAGQDELVAVVAVEVPGAGAAVDDGLEGAESALGGGAAAGQVDGQGLGLLAGERGGVAGEQFAGVGGAGPGDPDVLQDVVEVRLGQVDVVLGHAVGDLAEVAADVGQGRAVRAAGWWPGCAGPGGGRTAEVEVGDPGAEAGVEPGVGQGASAVGVADVGGEQRQLGAFGGGGWAAVAFGEECQGLALAFFEPLVEMLGDADGRVVVADLGLVVPEHGAARRSGRRSPGAAG